MVIAYTAGGGLTLLQRQDLGIEVLAENLTDKDDFKSFVFEASRFVGKPEMAELFSKITSFPSRNG